MFKQTDKILADALIQQKLMDKNKLIALYDQSISEAQPLRKYLALKNILTEDQIVKALSQTYNIPMIDLQKIPVDKSATEKVPVRLAWFYKCMPFKLVDKGVYMASSLPIDVKIQDEIQVHLGLRPQMFLARENDVLESIKKSYGLAADTIDRILARETLDTKEKRQHDDRSGVEDLEKQPEDASVAKLVNQILLEAYHKRATDVHIEPYRKKVRIRYRIDGVLVDANLPEEVRHFLLPILSRIKLMANLSIVEKRIPQDGSAVVKTKDQVLDLRISTIPTTHGESMVIRLLPTKVMLFSLEKLGLDKTHVRIFKEQVAKPHGIVLVTGPTGSGKSTTLYACLNEINTAKRKIITIEDPIEYEMEGVTQIQVNPKVSLSFAAGLRSVLRHDPDIVMVGEIRDQETAEIAIRTALTGHLVFSTLHTNDAASGVTRLLEMGIEPFLVSSSVEVFVAQRLVRIICPYCKEEVTAPMVEIKEEIAEALDIKDIDAVKVFYGKGCDYCNHTGYYGRTAIYEMLVVNDAIRSAILEKPRADHIKRLAIDSGMKTLRQAGWRKVIEGVTTPVEVINVTERDYLLAGEGHHNISAVRPSSDGIAVHSSSPQKIYQVITEDLLAGKNEYDARTYKRVAVRLEVRYQVLKEMQKGENRMLQSDGVDHSSVTKDVSAGGLRFVSGYSMPVGMVLDLKIELAKDAPTIDCLAKICRVEENNVSATFNIAVFYLNITSADRAKIDQFVNSQADENKSSCS